MKIEAKEICFSYEEKTILKSVTLTLDSAQPVVLLGSSGRGKTTLLRVLAGLEKPQSGKINGIDASTRIAVMYQEDRLFPHMSVYKNLKLIRPDVTKQQVQELLAELNLSPDVMEQLPKELSGGMRRRVALARTLLFKADLLLMDEPFQGLDEKTHKMAQSAVKKWTKGRPLLLISHDPLDGLALGAKVLTMEELNHE